MRLLPIQGLLSLIFAAGQFGMCAQAETPRVIQAWSFYSTPPFVVDERSNAGLCKDLIDQLNRRLAGKYEIQLNMVPRARVNRLLESGATGVVLFAPSMTFGGISGSSPYSWSIPLMRDRQTVISLKEHPVEYAGPASLHHRDLGGLLGHVYPELQPDIDTGRIRLERPSRERDLLAMLQARRVDAITLPESSVRYLFNIDKSMRVRLHVSEGVLAEFTRHMIFQRGMNRQRDDIDRALISLQQDASWRSGTVRVL